MPEPRNIVQLIQQTINKVDVFKSQIAGLNSRINQTQYYHDKNGVEYFDYPILFALKNNIFSHIPVLLQHGSQSEIEGTAVTVELLRKKAPLDIIQYCINHNHLSEINKYQALLVAYDGSHDGDIKFEVLHQHCFKLKVTDLIHGKAPDGMSDTDFALHSKEFVSITTKHADIGQKLKEIYLKIIKCDRDFKSALKIELIRGSENAIINLLRSRSQDAELSDTKEFQELKNMVLSNHSLTTEYLDHLFDTLKSEPRPNPALAALYFSYRVCESELEKNVLSLHLIKIDKENYTINAERAFDAMKSSHLNAKEFQNLKNNLYAILAKYTTLQPQVSLDSPLTLLCQTGRRSRRLKHTNTYDRLCKLGLFQNTPEPNRTSGGRRLPVLAF